VIVRQRLKTNRIGFHQFGIDSELIALLHQNPLTLGENRELLAQSEKGLAEALPGLLLSRATPEKSRDLVSRNELRGAGG
jgi:hypothetical protein